jgi:gliding motility-associated-like protein
LCFSESTGSIDLTVDGGVAPFSYLWSNGDVTEDLNEIPAGSYDVVVTDSNGCTSTRIMSLSEPLSALALSETHTDALCIGGDQGTIDLTVAGGTPDYTYLWNNNEIVEDIIDLVPGIYTGEVTDGNGCIDSISIEILDPSNTMELSIVETDVSCFEGEDGALDLTVVGGAAPYSFDWSNTEVSEDLSGLETGNYFVIVTDNNTCESFISGFVDQPDAALSASDVVTSVICNSDSTGVIDITTSGGTLPYSFDWDNGSIDEDIDSLPAGTYTLVITDDNLCTDTNTYIVNEPLALVLGSDLTDATCFGDNDGIIDLTPAGGVAPYSYQWSNDSTTQDLDSLIAGDYTLVLTDDNLCTAEVTLTINEPLAPISVTADSSNISCFGGNDGFIDITVAGGNGSYSYVWSNAALTEDLTDLFIGTYTVAVQDFKGCTTNLTMTLTQPDEPLGLSVEMTPVICFSENNGTATVTAQGGTAPYSYLWSNTEDSLFIDSLIAGDYSVVVTDSLLCTDSITITVTEPPVLTAVADSIDVLCFGDSTGTVSVVAQGGVGDYTYLWDTGTADTTTVVDSLPAGTYTVTVTDTNSCVFITSTTINQPLAPLSGVLDVTDNICFGEALGSIDAIISGGTVPYGYQWSNDSTTAYIDSLAVGAYTLTVTDSNACVFIIDTIIVSPTLLVVQDTVSNVNCFAGSDGWIDLTVSEATAPYQYLWNNADTLQDIDSLTAGTYEVVITDSNSCVTIYPVTVTEPLAPLALSMDSINVFCFGDTTGSIDLSVTGGTPGYSYLWNIGDTLQDIDSLITGTYQVIVTDTNQCVDSLSVFIDQPLAPIALSATQVDILCFGDATGEVDLTVSGGTPASTGYVFDWNSGAFTTEDLTDIPFGPYAVLVTDSLLCSDTLSVTLTQPDAPIAIDFTILNVSCFGDSTGDVLGDISGGTVPYAWTWDAPIVDTTLFIDSLPIGDYVLNVIDSNNCEYQQTATVTQPDAPLTVTYDEVLPSCFEYSDGVLTLIPAGGTAPYSYLWNTGDTTISIDSLATGDFSAQIVDTLGCFTSIDIFLAEPPELQISLDVDTLSGCSPFVVQFTNTSNATANCEWDFGNGNTYTGCENVFNVYEEGGVYSVALTAYDDNGCFNDVTYNDFITVYQTPTAAMNIDPAYLYPDIPTTNILNESVGGDTFVWNMGDTPLDFMGFEPGAYTYSPNLIDTFYVSLTAYTDEGCIDSTQGFVAFLNDPFLYAPNSFTPDANILNDVWIPIFSSPQYLKRYNLDIYNRWGERVFETTDLNQGWDGTYQGSPVQDGTYTWKINFRWYDQRAFELTGHITLIK